MSAAKAFRSSGTERPLDGALYTLWAAGYTLASARAFYGSMLKQTGGDWSAPLDDVFIHFDYARATALGHPFEWVVGNGYSSGNTSLLYPFILALGYRAGFTGARIMVWAALVAAVCVFGVLLFVRRLLIFPERKADAWARASAYLLPPMLLGVGALDWSLWSGMEVAFLLATWACAMRAYLALVEASPDRVARPAWVLGAWGALMVLSRPEAATTTAVLGFAAGFVLYRARGAKAALATLSRSGSPSLLVVSIQAVANRALTGEWAASGAIVKLALYNPFLSHDQKVDDYVFNLKYAVLRNLEYHFTDLSPLHLPNGHALALGGPVLGVLIPALALAALALPRCRHVGLVLWAQITSWLLVVAFNGQVRWQNERYTMPAVAWLLVAAALGASGLLRRAGRPNVLVVSGAGALIAQLVGVALRQPDTAPELRFAWSFALAWGVAGAVVLLFWPVRAVCVVGALAFAYVHQAANMRGQRWFFGRASRNIRDQHIVAGQWLAAHEARRVLVGDAGALVYASDRPGLDIIGLGGYHGLPFARAGVNGLAATVELMEHVSPRDRPDVLAIYPSWWGVLPTWFGGGVLARFPVEGNVICGGYEDVVYAADWRLLGTGTLIRMLPPGEMVRDSVDVADLLSEAEHNYRFPAPEGGWTEMKILADPTDASADMLDGGRRIAAGLSEHFSLRGLDAKREAHLVVRSAPEKGTRVRARVGGVEAGALDLEATEGWVEPTVAIPADAVGREVEVELFNEGPGDFIDYHAWVTQ